MDRENLELLRRAVEEWPAARFNYNEINTGRNNQCGCAIHVARAKGLSRRRGDMLNIEMEDAFGLGGEEIRYLFNVKSAMTGKRIRGVAAKKVFFHRLKEVLRGKFRKG
jgi:hypothetical protein